MSRNGDGWSASGIAVVRVLEDRLQSEEQEELRGSIQRARSALDRARKGVGPSPVGLPDNQAAHMARRRPTSFLPFAAASYGRRALTILSAELRARILIQKPFAAA